MSAPDRPGPPRPGEELDPARLGEYLAARLGRAEPVVVEQFPAGHSNLTYHVRVGSASYVLRRPPFGNRVKTAHDMAREFRVLSALAPVFPPAPKPLLLCEDESVLGAPFYLMERRHGLVIRKELPRDLKDRPDTLARICDSLVTTLARLHEIDPAAVGLADLGRPEGYVERQVRGWTQRYHAAATEHVPDMEAAARWLAEELPSDPGASIIHNDFKFDNVMLDADDPTRVVAVLDWEMATLGHPLMDLGSSLAYWVEPNDPAPIRGLGWWPTAEPGMWSRREVVGRYFEARGTAPVALGFYFVFGFFKLAVIIQQIYARYRRGATADARFAEMNRMVAVLANRAVQVAHDPGI
ncbi:MAG: phosphotransferase family protein [Gemmatimonadales bacterium]